MERTSGLPMTICISGATGNFGGTPAVVDITCDLPEPALIGP
jgi:hypothetical protein